MDYAKNKSSHSPQNITKTIDEPDEYEERIIKTGCAKENEELQICFADKKDWRLCQKELNNFKECWKRKGYLLDNSLANLSTALYELYYCNFDFQSFLN
ncbi:11654_t:CDS:2 [Rhizophagus irregularis]|nr:11654_t:CDS:2 [Rhizophagus irregularis]